MSSLHYRQNIVASIRIAGHQIGDVVSHGGNRAAGSHITACFGSQVMVTMLDLAGVMQFANAWIAAEHQWVYRYLPAELPGAISKEAVSTGPSLTVRANGVDKIDARYDSTARSAHPGRSGDLDRAGLGGRRLDDHHLAVRRPHCARDPPWRRSGAAEPLTNSVPSVLPGGRRHQGSGSTAVVHKSLDHRSCAHMR